MIPLENLGQVLTGDRRSLELYRRGKTFYLYLDRYPLLSSDATACEAYMASRLARRLAERRRPRVLLDGIALGSLLRHTLAALRAKAEVVVVEPNEALLQWHREGPLSPLTGDLFLDERILVEPSVLGQCLGKSPAHFDAVIIDLDFAVTPFFRSSKSVAECQRKFSLVKQAMRPGGRIFLRSVASEPAVLRVLERMDYTIEQQWLSPTPSGKGRRQCITEAWPLPAQPSA